MRGFFVLALICLLLVSYPLAACSESVSQFELNSETLLRSEGDAYLANNDIPSAIKVYEKLAEDYPTFDYKMKLENLYMLNEDFAKAEEILKPLYEANPKHPQLVESYLRTLLAQQKTKQAYWVVKKHNLEQTRDGYMILGDMAMLDKDYYTAEYDYKKAIALDPEDAVLQNKLANSYRMLGSINMSAQIFNNILANDPKNIEAKLGLGYLEICKKNYSKARNIFQDILAENPEYKPAQTAIVDSYVQNDDKLSALRFINKIVPDNEIKLMEAQAYYDVGMWSDSKSVLKGVATKDAEALKYKIRRDEAITITPNYSFFFQQLADEFKLDYHKFGVNMAKNIDENKNVFMEYNVIVYSSGHINGSFDKRNNVVNEFKGGIQARPSEKWEYRADFGVKAFEFGNGAMLITDSWIKHYFSDNFNLKAGYKRNNMEQSYTSAVGQPINGIFTGRACDNKFYFEANRKLPKQFYAYGLGAVGFIYAQNLPTNPYFEGMVGAGRLLYNNPHNKWINTFSADVISYNSSYQYNLLRLYSSTGQLYGGYFSPDYFNATTLSLKAEGNIKKWRLRYGIKGFGGIQTAITPDFARPTWSFAPYITYDLNDNVSINALYSHLNYADLTRDQFAINAVIRGFKSRKK